MNELVHSNTFWSAVKRKSVLEILALVFEEAGLSEVAEECKNSTRITDAFMGRVKSLVPEEVVEAGEAVKEAVKEAVEEEVDAITEAFNDMDAAIEAGKRKKAKKIYKLMKENGIDGSEMDKRKKLIKKMEK